MSVFQTAYDAHLTISGHDITWREIIGNGFGFASAIGGMRRRVWAWQRCRLVFRSDSS